MDLGAMNQLPSAAHLLGTDFVGRDLLARAMVGTQAFFLPGLLSVGVSLLFGTLFGVLAGFAQRVHLGLDKPGPARHIHALISRRRSRKRAPCSRPTSPWG